ncbi:hypothetical protein HDU85_000574 [Gaertneriomyces sp. JEL0708]|nr:hypothetical protein HDU85_000574 [Gaertneriomyces sp. JEL0708]
MILPGHGFHQNLLIRLPPISLATQDLLFLLHFPRHTFADRYELARITWPDGLDVQSLGDADLEAGAYMDAARPHIVAVTVHSKLFSGNKISIPFHMRYQPPSTASSVEVPAIRVTGYLITYEDFMMPISKATDLQMTSARYNLPVPVGDVHDSQWIEAATHIVVVSGAIAVLVNICRTDRHLKAASRREQSQGVR